MSFFYFSFPVSFLLLNAINVSRDGYLALSEVNTLNQFVGDPAIDQATLEQICWTFVPDFNPEVDKGLTGDGYVKICVKSLMDV